MDPIQVSKYFKFVACVFTGVIVWLLKDYVGAPETGWQLFSVFIAVVLGFVLRPFPMGIMVILGLIAITATGAVSMEQALSGYADTTVWLVVAAFLIAGAVIHSGFGRRVALTMVSWMGKSMLGLGYAITGAELILGPVVPSNTARGGGIIAPIMDSLSRTLGSTPEKQPEQAGRYLSLVGSNVNLVTAAMFLTGMAANPLISKAIEDIYKIDFGWGEWALGAIVPGLVSLAVLPFLIYKLAPPGQAKTSMAQEEARSELSNMGKMGWREKTVLITLAILLILWITKPIHHMGTTLVAWIGVAVLLISQEEKWKEIIGNEKAWDTMIWLGGLLTMANLLKEYGFIDWFAENMQGMVAGFAPVAVVLALGLIYFYSMYAFSMFTAHISAMAASFIAVCFAANGPAMLVAGIFAYFSCLCGCLTNYSTGPVVIYFGLGYVHPKKWFSVGFVISIVQIAIWFGIGMLWWKILGWY